MTEGMEYRVASDGRRLDVGLSRSRVASLMEDGLCVSGGKACTKAGTKLPAGQEIVLTVPAPKEAVPKAEDIPLEILYEDEDLAVVIKPRGMVVHPAAGHPDGTLVNALLARLDSLGGLSRMLKDREIEKHYRALVEGRFKEPEGEINAAIDRSKKDRKKMAVDPEGRPALTRWKVLAEGQACTLLDVHILTGRTHQIRVHMRSIQHPVCGDELYGFEKGVKVPCLMLHAYSLRFKHPRTKEEMAFQAPLPEDFLKGLKSNGIEINSEFRIHNSEL